MVKIIHPRSQLIGFLEEVGDSINNTKAELDALVVAQNNVSAKLAMTKAKLNHAIQSLWSMRASLDSELITNIDDDEPFVAAIAAPDILPVAPDANPGSLEGILRAPTYNINNQNAEVAAVAELFDDDSDSIPERQCKRAKYHRYDQVFDLDSADEEYEYANV